MFTLVNAAACTMLGYSREELLAAPLETICLTESWKTLAEKLETARKHGSGVVAFHVVLRTKAGKTQPAEWRLSQFELKEGKGWLILSRIVMAEYSWDESGQGSADSCGLGLPGHDPLTGLPDRRLFKRRLQRALEHCKTDHDYAFAVGFVDLDGFKSVNDAWGHMTGDYVLCEVARRFVGALRQGDMVARFGGDEFLVFWDGVRTTSDALSAGRRMLSRLEEPCVVRGHELKVGASIGIALKSVHIDRTADLLHAADRAMYHAKALGGNTITLGEQASAMPRRRPR